MYEIKLLLISFLFLALPVVAQPVKQTDWKQPHINNAVHFPNYTSVLDCSHKTPYYVFYNLFPKDFAGHTADRSNKWPSSVPCNIKIICGGGYATTKDYTKSGYDRGHLAPAADFDMNQLKQNATFSFANAAPQNKQLNRGPWQSLEEYERNLAIKHNGITVITGVIQSNKTIGHSVGVPSYFYKIFLWEDKGFCVQAFIVKNADEAPHEVDVREIEVLAELDFGV